MIVGEVRGLEVARVVVDPDGSARVEAGVGRFGADPGEAALEVVLDCLDVVDGLALDRRELGDIRRAEVRDDPAQRGDLVGREGAHAGDGAPRREVDEPLHLDMNPSTAERGLTELIDERRNDAGDLAGLARREAGPAGRTSRRA